MNLHELLKDVVYQGATDLHLTVGAPPTMRLKGCLTPLLMRQLTPDDTRELAGQILNKEKFQQFNEKGEFDLSYSYFGVGRFRAAFYRQRGTISMVIRTIKTEIPSLASLGLPSAVAKLALRHKGLMIVSGLAGSGKSTTMAAILNNINEENSRHIITLENPIEYLHTHKKSLIDQREIGSDTSSYSSALLAALRQDPDIIMIGDLTDPETVSTAINAAESGYLVMAALQASNVVKAMERLIDFFPLEQQQHFRQRLAGSLLAVTSQRLLPRKEGRGMIAALEYLVISPNVRMLIREGNMDHIYTIMQGGAEPGMQTMDKHLQSLFDKGLIEASDLLDNAEDLVAMSQHLTGSSAEDDTEVLIEKQ